jgi:hypothetical protein
VASGHGGLGRCANVNELINRIQSRSPEGCERYCPGFSGSLRQYHPANRLVFLVLAIASSSSNSKLKPAWLSWPAGEWPRQAGAAPCHASWCVGPSPAPLVPRERHTGNSGAPAADPARASEPACPGLLTERKKASSTPRDYSAADAPDETPRPPSQRSEGSGCGPAGLRPVAAANLNGAEAAAAADSVGFVAAAAVTAPGCS